METITKIAVTGIALVLIVSAVYFGLLIYEMQTEWAGVPQITVNGESAILSGMLLRYQIGFRKDGAVVWRKR